MEGTEAAPVSGIFPESVVLKDCTCVTCTNGHSWVPMAAMAKCGFGTPQGWNGCGSPVVAFKMANCPQCNEPAAKLRLRIDYTPPCQYPVPLCIPGSRSHAETLFIEAELRHYQQTEAAEVVKKENNG